MSEKARLFLLPAGFEDPAYPGQRFLCRHGALVEGALKGYPEVLAAIDIERVGFPRPRERVIALVGEAYQSLPLLVLPPGETATAATGFSNGRAFVAGAEAILQTLAERHGLPVVHP
ncbi:MAG TPA: DUF3088 domain-containing protein [Kaistia sp.]|nr:DUF3088 domain-containing protein [Kaistia sp.]